MDNRFPTLGDEQSPAQPYQHQKYPRAMYHKDGSHVIVHSEAEAKELGDEYVRGPHKKAEQKPEPKAKEAKGKDKAEQKPEGDQK